MTPEEAEQKIRAWFKGKCEQVDHSMRLAGATNRDLARGTMIFSLYGYLEAFVDLGNLPHDRADPLRMELIKSLSEQFQSELAEERKEKRGGNP